MFDYNSFYDFIKIDKKSISDLKKKGSVHKPNIFAIHFGRLISYNPSWKLDKIVAFERFMHLSKQFKHEPFTQKYPMLLKYTRCSTVRLGKIINELEDEGYLEVIREKKGKVSKLNLYSVKFDNILTSIEKIYNFKEMSKEDKSASIEIIKEFIKYHSENAYKEKKVTKKAAKAVDKSEGRSF